MALAPLISQRSSALSAFRGGVEREAERWQDHRFAAIRGAHLEPLIAENRRFDRELAAVETAVRAANRRLEQSR